MPETFASAVVPADPATVWSLIRDFNGLPRWQPAVAASTLDPAAGSNGAGIGVQRVLTMADGARVVEALVALDDTNRALTYQIVDSPYPVRFYRARIQVLPVTSTGDAFVAWSVTFDCDAEQEHELVAVFRDDIFTTGLHGLAHHLTDHPADHPADHLTGYRTERIPS